MYVRGLGDRLFLHAINELLLLPTAFLENGVRKPDGCYVYIQHKLVWVAYANGRLACSFRRDGSIPVWPISQTW